MVNCLFVHLGMSQNIYSDNVLNVHTNSMWKVKASGFPLTLILHVAILDRKQINPAKILGTQLTNTGENFTSKV